MAVIPEITCRRCGNKYSGLHARCPKCGAPRVNQPTRVPPTTASATPRTAASARSAMNIQWQFVFAGVLLLALILAVVVLVTTGGGRNNANSNNPNNVGNVSNQGGVTTGYTTANLPTPSPSPEPTPDATPTPEIELLAITFLNKTRPDKDMTLTNAGEIVVDLDVNMYPAVDNPAVVWESSNEKILTVDDRGIFTVVGASPNRTVHAVITASYGGLMDYVVVYVPPFQVAYLTENRFDPDTYDMDNYEWDVRLNATPTPRP